MLPLSLHTGASCNRCWDRCSNAS